MLTAFRYLTSIIRDDILVLSLNEPQVRGDEMADGLARELTTAVDQSSIGKIVVDLKNVQFMSSVGFRPLLQLHQKAKEKHGRVVLCNLTKDVADVLHVTRLITTSRSMQAPFEEQPDVEAAIASLKAGQPA